MRQMIAATNIQSKKQNKTAKNRITFKLKRVTTQTNELHRVIMYLKCEKFFYEYF